MTNSSVHEKPMHMVSTCIPDDASLRKGINNRTVVDFVPHWMRTANIPRNWKLLFISHTSLEERKKKKKKKNSPNIRSSKKVEQQWQWMYTGGLHLQHLRLSVGYFLGLLSGERRWQCAWVETCNVPFHGVHHAVPVQALGRAGHGFCADLHGLLGHGGLVPEQLGVLGEQVQHVVVDVVHAHLLPHKLAALLADELRLRQVLVAPVNGELDGFADVVPVDGPVVLAGDEPPGQDVLEGRGDEQHRRVTRQDVFLAHRSRIPLHVNLVPTSIDR